MINLLPLVSLTLELIPLAEHLLGPGTGPQKKELVKGLIRAGEDKLPWQDAGPIGPALQQLAESDVLLNPLIDGCVALWQARGSILPELFPPAQLSAAKAIAQAAPLDVQHQVR